MFSHRRNVFETIRDKRQWHTSSDADASKLGFRGWYSRGYLPHFDLPGLVQFINCRLDDAMPASLRHEWAALLELDDELKRRTKIEEYLDRGRKGSELSIARPDPLFQSLPALSLWALARPPKGASILLVPYCSGASLLMVTIVPGSSATATNSGDFRLRQ